MKKIEITIIDNRTAVKIDDEVEIYIEGSFEIKKKEPVIKATDVTIKT